MGVFAFRPQRAGHCARRAVGARAQKRGGWGRIVLISSGAAEEGQPGLEAYAAAKAGAAGWVAGRAVEVPHDGDGHSFRIDNNEVVITRLGGKGLLIESWNPERGYRAVDRA